MQSLLDALPGQPLSPEAVEALNDAASVRLIPYSWSGEQVITVLLDENQRLSGGRFEPPKAEPSNTMGTESEDPIEFDTGDSGPLGTVEVIEPESLLPDGSPFLEADDTEQQGSGASGVTGDGASSAESPESDDAGDGQVTAIGYSSEETAWVVIGDLDPGSTLRDAEPLVREWLAERYHEQMLDRIAVGPSEYELSGDSP